MPASLFGALVAGGWVASPVAVARYDDVHLGLGRIGASEPYSGAIGGRGRFVPESGIMVDRASAYKPQSEFRGGDDEWAMNEKGQLRTDRPATRVGRRRRGTVPTPSRRRQCPGQRPGVRCRAPPGPLSGRRW